MQTEKPTGELKYKTEIDQMFNTYDAYLNPQADSDGFAPDGKMPLLKIFRQTIQTLHITVKSI
ncbi:MAG: hypothetical protein CM15mV42_0930 [uncultured marine virus]|nr:MAG: hypothetical protein CM15mV42_0930 [uncultured marine virus]